MTGPREPLIVATSLQQLGEEDAVHRVIISRAHYTAYHRGADFHGARLPSPGAAPPEGIHGVHERLIYRLLNPTCTDRTSAFTSRAAGYMLQGAKLARVHADYRLAEPVKQSDALAMLATASTLLTQLGY